MSLPEPALLVAGFVFGTLGVYLIKEGKRLSNVGKIVIGVTLLVYPYFFSSAVITWVIGVVLFSFSFRL